MQEKILICIRQGTTLFLIRGESILFVYRLNGFYLKNNSHYEAAEKQKNFFNEYLHIAIKLNAGKRLEVQSE